MNLVFRMLRVFVMAWWRSKLSPVQTSTVTFHVFPNDLDVFMHMNNGRYPTMMDLGRLDLITRIGMSTLMFSRRWFPIVAAVQMRFRRPLYVFQKYQIVSRIHCWDEKWFYLEQRFERKGELIAVGWVKGLIRGPQGNIPTAEVLAAVGAAMTSPEMPEIVVAWRDAESIKSQ